MLNERNDSCEVQWKRRGKIKWALLNWKWKIKKQHLTVTKFLDYKWISLR